MAVIPWIENLVKSIYGINSLKEWEPKQIAGGSNFSAYDIEKANAMLQTEGYLAEVGTQSDGFWDTISEIDLSVNNESTEGVGLEVDASNNFRAAMESVVEAGSEAMPALRREP